MPELDQEYQTDSRRMKIENLIERLRKLETDASRSNMASFEYGEELARRRIALEKKLLDEDIDEFYENEE